MVATIAAKIMARIVMRIIPIIWEFADSRCMDSL
jgi:hypothetical protein